MISMFYLEELFEVLQESFNGVIWAQLFKANDVVS